jgi:hypothetical protein
MKSTRKSLILTSVLAALMAAAVTQVKAEAPTAWPRDIDITVNHGSPYAPRAAAKSTAAPVNAWTAPFSSYADWAALPTTFDKGQPTITAKELDAQVAGYRAYWLKRNQSLIDSNGDLVPVLPVRVHERLNAKAFGSPVMGGDN